MPFFTALREVEREDATRMAEYLERASLARLEYYVKSGLQWAQWAADIHRHSRRSWMHLLEGFPVNPGKKRKHRTETGRTRRPVLGPK
jgi:hypothetical protein